MEVKIEIPEYNNETGIKYNWTNGFEIEVSEKNGAILLLANKEGLLSLANHFLNLAQEEIPSGYHLHLDEHNSLEEKSLDLIIQKK